MANAKIHLTVWEYVFTNIRYIRVKTITKQPILEWDILINGFTTRIMSRANANPARALFARAVHIPVHDDGGHLWLGSVGINELIEIAHPRTRTRARARVRTHAWYMYTNAWHMYMYTPPLPRITVCVV